MWCKVGGQEEYSGADGDVGIEAVDKLAGANGVRLYCHVLRRPKEDVLMKAMVRKVDGKHIQDEMEKTS